MTYTFTSLQTDGTGAGSKVKKAGLIYKNILESAIHPGAGKSILAVGAYLATNSNKECKGLEV